MKSYVTVGLTMLAGAALIEAALIPGLVIGGAAMLAPKYLPKLRRQLRPASNGAARRRTPSAATASAQTDAPARQGIATKLGVTQAIAKTITFRVIVTTLDFTTNYIVIGELTTAAGLSTFNLIAGPLLYLGHETGWNYLGGSAETAVDISGLLPGRRGADPATGGRGGFTISRALAKTVTYRTIATVADFTASYVAVRDVATAAGLTAFGFVLGPFVYYGHEWLWDRYGSPQQQLALPAPESVSPAAA